MVAVILCVPDIPVEFSQLSRSEVDSVALIGLNNHGTDDPPDEDVLEFRLEFGHRHPLSIVVGEVVFLYLVRGHHRTKCRMLTDPEWLANCHVFRYQTRNLRIETAMRLE